MFIKMQTSNLNRFVSVFLFNHIDHSIRRNEIELKKNILLMELKELMYCTSFPDKLITVRLVNEFSCISFLICGEAFRDLELKSKIST